MKLKPHLATFVDAPIMAIDRGLKSASNRLSRTVFLHTAYKGLRNKIMVDCNGFCQSFQASSHVHAFGAGQEPGETIPHLVE
jgi:hypothetical protein